MSLNSLNEWSASTVSLALAIVLQSTVFAVLAGGTCWLLRRSAPALRYWCWQIVALKLLVMPWWIVTVPLPGFLSRSNTEPLPRATATNDVHKELRGMTPDAPTTAPAESAEPATRRRGLFDLVWQLTWQSWLVLLWLVGVSAQVGRLAAQRGGVRRLLSRTVAVSDPALLAAIDDAAARLGLRHPPGVVLSESRGAPFVCGMFRPVLVLSREIAMELDAAQLRDVLLHEFGHIKRHDLWWGWLPALVRMLYFYHPVAHWLCFRVRLERELACDQLAMVLSGRGAAEYAEVLFQVVSRASLPAAIPVSSLQGLSTFWKRRITMLVSTRQSSPRLSRGAYLGIAATAVAVCLLPTFQRAGAQAHDPTTAKPAGRIYVSASYRVKPDEDKTIYNAIVAIDPDTGKWQLVVEKGHDMRLSPDRRTLVFNRFIEHTWKIDGTWKCESDGQFPIKISDHGGRPIWSPDGKHLVVTTAENLDKDNDKDRTAPAWRDETWRLDADGRNAVRLPIPETDAVADWSPDGQWFVTVTDRHPPYGHGYQLYLMKTDGTQERRLTHGGLNVYACFSPDGNKVLYLHQTRAAGNSIWTVDVDGENATEIVKEEGLSSPDGAFWSPDGKQIAVILFDWELDEKGEKVRTAGNDHHFRIEVMDADGTNRRRIPIEEPQLRFIGSLGDWR